MNILDAGSNELVCIDYSDLLDKILQVIKTPENYKLFTVIGGQKLLIDIDAVASQVARMQVDNPLGGSVNNVKSATVNFSPSFRQRFPQQIQDLKNCLQQLFQNEINLDDLVNSLITDIQTFKSEKEGLNFAYPFHPYPNLEKQRLSVADKKNQDQQLLRFHKLTISIQKTSEFNQQLRDGLENYIKMQFAGDEELGYILNDLYEEKGKSESDFYKLKQIIDTQTLGKLKKQAQINYLEYLYENVDSHVNVDGVLYLQDMIRRLKLIEVYINDINKADGEYLVNYAGVSLNYKDIFSRGEAFDMLPIIPKIDGYLGEAKDEQRGEIRFIFGLKLKFDGKVQAFGGKTVFEYYLNLLNPDSEEHQAELASSTRETFAKKVLKIAFLYYFLFATNPNSELSYDPIAAFEQKILTILIEGDDAQKQNLFRKILKGFEKYNVASKVNQIKALLKKVINRVTTFPTREYPIHISINNGLLEKNINNIYNQNSLFQSVIRGNPKEVLKYITVGEANSQYNSLCTFPAKITISDIHYVACDDKQTFQMEYDLNGINTLPVLLLPWKDQKCQEIYHKHFANRRLILFPYRLESSKLEAQQEFIYNFTFSLLVYICLKVILYKRRLFIPILRFHLHNHDEDAPIEKFIAAFSGVLSHLLNEEHRANTQGVDIRDLKYKIPNVLSSLYSVLPKKFIFTNQSECPKIINKLAIIIVSSRESDKQWNSEQKLSNLMGEILGLRREDNGVRVQLLKTFAENYEHQQMFRQPTIIMDEVAKLYRMGYRHFVYIAKAPYTSTLHMTQVDDDGLFFLSKDVIQALKAQHEDIKIYPMFFDKYYAVRLRKIGVSSLYIQDTAELTNLVDDPSQKSVVFFNLFNGIVVGNERNYNGVMSYATLLNIYEDILDDEDIRKGLIYKGELKNDILQYLTLFHFSRYEKAKQVNLKLDPYENLIGENSVGANSLIKHMRLRSEFNMLAFLSMVRKVLNA